MPTLPSLAGRQVWSAGGSSRLVGRKPGARCVMEGSLSRVGDRLRVNAQLIGVQGGAHVWTNRYDRIAAKLFSLLDEITRAVACAAAAAVESAEHAGVKYKRSASLDAWEARPRA